jgi:hypothetical protein
MTDPQTAEPETVVEPGPDPAPTDAPDDPRDWRQEYVGEVQQARKYRRRAQHAEEELERLRSLRPSEEQLAELERLRGVAEQVQATRSRTERLETMLRRLAAQDELARALSACGVGAGCPHGQRMVAQASALLQDRIDVDLSGDAERPVVRVLDGAGETLRDETGEDLPVGRFVARWLAEEGAHFLPASGDTGSGSHRGRLTPASASLEQLDRNPGAKAAFIARHGPQAFVQLARRKPRRGQAGPRR